MAITDELRKEARGMLRYTYTTEHAKHLLAIADRIDAEHERLCSRSRSNGYGDGFTDGFNDIESWVVDHEDAMAGHGWYRALDMDKEVIHADDELFWKENGDSVGRVTAIGVGRRAGWVWTLLDGRDVSIGREARRLRHHHAQTVEDVLRQFLGECESAANLGYDEVPQEVFDDYVKRLKLRGDAE